MEAAALPRLLKKRMLHGNCKDKAAACAFLAPLMSFAALASRCLFHPSGVGSAVGWAIARCHSSNKSDACVDAAA